MIGISPVGSRLAHCSNLILCLLSLGGAGACSSSDAPTANGAAGGSSQAGGSYASAGAEHGIAGQGAAGGSSLQAGASSGGDSMVGGASSAAGANTAGSAGLAGAAGAGVSNGGFGGSNGMSPLGGAAGVGGDGNGAGSSGVETIHYSGRWNRNAERAITVNSGSYANAHFSGTGISARFDVSLNDPSDLPTIAWRIDDSATWKVAEVAATISMASGLSSGSHSITLVARGLDENKSRWSPPLVSSVTFLGFSVADGALAFEPRPAQPKLEILGDSITEGVIVQGSSYQGKSAPCWRNDAVYSYPTQTGLALGADYRQVGFGYQGLLKTGDGGVPAANDSFNWIYKDVPRDAWQADLVVINQGTNDSTKPAATFQAAYTTFVHTIRTAYPRAKIIALRPFSGAQQAQIKSVVDADRAAGDARIFYVDTTGWLTPGSDFADGLHPNVQGSAKAAAKLVAEIQKLGLP